MKKDMKQRLREKGWSEKDIDHAAGIMERAEKHKDSSHKFMDAAVYWFVLIAALIGNFVVSVVLIPMLLAYYSFHLYLMIVLMALTFGVVFTLLIKEIDDLTQTHYIMAGIFIPAVAIINVIFITNLANTLIQILKIGTQHNPLVIGIVYGVTFVLPQIFKRWLHKLTSAVVNW